MTRVLWLSLQLRRHRPTITSDLFEINPSGSTADKGGKRKKEKKIQTHVPTFLLFLTYCVHDDNFRTCCCWNKVLGWSLKYKWQRPSCCLRAVAASGFRHIGSWICLVTAPKNPTETKAFVAHDPETGFNFILSGRVQYWLWQLGRNIFKGALDACRRST